MIYPVSRKEPSEFPRSYRSCRIRYPHWIKLRKLKGTWNTLTEAMEDAVVGEGILNDNCTNVHIVNEMEIPILAMGLHDVVISASPEEILVSDKEQSSYIKPFVDKFEQQIMFAEKSWGRF